MGVQFPPGTPMQKIYIAKNSSAALRITDTLSRSLDLLPNNLMPAKRHIRLQAIFENLSIALLFFGFLKRLSLESDIFRL